MFGLGETGPLRTEMDKYCGDVDLSKYQISLEDYQKKFKKSPFGPKSYFDNIDKAFDKNEEIDFSNLMKGDSILAVAIVLVVFASLLSIFYCVWSCIGHKCCSKKRKAQVIKTYRKIELIVMTIGFVILFIVFLIWAIFGQIQSKGIVKNTKCLFASLHDNINYGATKEGTDSYGIQTIINKIAPQIPNFDKISKVNENSAAVQESGIKENSIDLESEFKSLSDNYISTAYTYPGLIDSSTSAIPSFANKAQTSLSKDWKTEKNFLVDTSNQLFKAAVDIKTGVETNDYPSFMNNTLETDKSIKSNMNEINKLYSSGQDKIGKVNHYTGFFTAEFVIFLIFFILLFVCFYLGHFTKQGQRAWLKKIPMICFAMFAIQVFLIWLFGKAFYHIGNYVCTTADGMIENENYMNKHYPTRVKEYDTLTKAISACVYKNGSKTFIGSITSPPDVILGALGAISEPLKSAESLKNDYLTVNQWPTPPIGKSMIDGASNAREFKTTERDSPDTQDFTAGRDAFNNLGCAKDTMAFTAKDCPAGSTPSKTTDGPKQGLGTPYCIVFDNMPKSFSNRYGNTVQCKSGTFTDGQNLLTNAANSVPKLIEKSNSFTQTINPVFSKEKTALSKLKTQLPGFLTELTNLKDAVDGLSAFVTDFQKGASCGYLQDQNILLQTMLCLEYVKPLQNMNSLSMTLGSFFLLISFLMFLCICLTQNRGGILDNLSDQDDGELTARLNKEDPDAYAKVKDKI